VHEGRVLAGHGDLGAAQSSAAYVSYSRPDVA
jgi:hypothetical protein